MPESDFENLVLGAKLLEKDRFGPKVYATADGRIVKLFRVKRRISSNLLSPYARRFADNAAALLDRGIKAPAVDFYGKVPHLNRQVVVYPMVPGKSLREILRDDTAAGEIMRRFGAFLATLHGKGILFRSIHFGNVIVDGDGMALIDFLDLKVFRKPLPEKRRIKNIRFLVKYPQDREMVRVHFGELREGYGHPHLFAELENLTQASDEAR